MKCFVHLSLILCLAVAVATQRAAQYDHGMNFTYPWPVQHYTFSSQFQTLSMAYMDVQPNWTTPDHPKDETRTIVLLHGKNFCSATWNETAHVLSGAGYRVIIPDQIGFCKSSKPWVYQFSLQQLALNTHGLLTYLGFNEQHPLTVLGHSMGGMLATRFALMYPTLTARLVLVDPIGLEDWKAKGVPYQSLDVSYVGEHAQNFSTIKAYQQNTYYAGTWSPAYDVWVSMLEGVYRGPEGVQFAWDMALVTDMVYTQPIVYEFPLLKMRTLLIIGNKDNTAIGKTWAPPEVQPLLGHYGVLGKEVVKMIPNGTLIEFPDLGHAPQIQDPAQFHQSLLAWLDG